MHSTHNARPSATFNTVDHPILLKRLQDEFGIHDKALQWLTSYLRDRTQQVVINEIRSQPIILNVNVPQGSILGPGGYSDYTNPVGEVIRENNINPYFYMDDSQSYQHFIASCSTSTNKLLQNLESCCKDIKAWMTANMLQLNDTKTEAMIFGTPSKLKNCTIDSFKIGESNIIPSQHVKNSLSFTSKFQFF